LIIRLGKAHGDRFRDSGLINQTGQADAALHGDLVSEALRGRDERRKNAKQHDQRAGHHQETATVPTLHCVDRWPSVARRIGAEFTSAPSPEA
jgi:hypothetical protein